MPHRVEGRRVSHTKRSGRVDSLAPLDADTALRIADRVASAAARLLTAGRDSDVRRLRKADGECVTVVDRGTERMVRRLLRRLTPSVAVLGEECGGDVGLRDGWVVDPLDGTENYCRRSPLCGVQLAYLIDGKPHASAIMLPFLDERYVAGRHRGAARAGTRIAVSTPTSLRDAAVCLDLGGRSAADGLSALAGRLSGACARVMDLGSSAVALAWVAAGVLDAAVLHGNLPWDVLPGILMVEEAGGMVVDIGGGAHGPASSWTIASAPWILDSLVAVLGEATERV